MSSLKSELKESVGQFSSCCGSSFSEDHSNDGTARCDSCKEMCSIEKDFLGHDMEVLSKILPIEKNVTRLDKEEAMRMLLQHFNNEIHVSTEDAAMVRFIVNVIDKG